MPKSHSGIKRGSKRGGGKELAKTQAELQATRAELEATQAELEDTKAKLNQLQDDYDSLMEHVLSLNEQALNQVTKAATKSNSKYAKPTLENFRSVYDELHQFREFPRICDLRKKLDWSREAFDGMIRTLRDNRTIQIFRADESMMTQDEIRDCFVDENRIIQGIMIWNER